MMRILAIVGGVVGTLLLALIGQAIYGLFLQDREVQLKGYLSERRSAKRHRRLVAAFVAAMQGKAALTDTRIQVQRALAGPAFLCRLMTVVTMAAYFTSIKGEQTLTRGRAAIQDFRGHAGRS